jgi:tetrapyrrole methylase family protein/MazG family protein
VPGQPDLPPSLAALAASARTLGGNLLLLDATKPSEPNPLLPTLVHNLEDPAAFRNLRRILVSIFPADHSIALVDKDGPRWLAVNQLEGLESVDRGATLYLPAAAAEQAGGSPSALRAIVQRLRAPGGCPWDREQTPRSLTRYVLEEAYEVVEAIESGDQTAVEEELGDLLLQVYLQSEIAEEAGAFSLTEVMRTLVAKLVRRHPHVFGNLTVADADEVERNWATLKREEKGVAVSPVSSVPRNLPALEQARELQRRLAKGGFDWHDRQGGRAKLREELEELAAAEGDAAATEQELGDVLFMLVKVFGDDGLDLERALRGTNERVKARYGRMGEQAESRGSKLEAMPIEEQLELWQQAKREAARQAERQ